MILIVVLVVIAMLTLVAVSFSELMLTERQAAELSVRQAQARAAAESGVEAARMLVTLDPQTQMQAGGCYDNANLFRGVVVNEMPDGEDPRSAHDRCRFAVVAPNMVDGELAGVRFGVQDESARLNLSSLVLADKAVPGGARQILMGLPGMTEDIADAILDWIDSDDEPREYGAEMEVYSATSPPRTPKNGPLDTIEELLNVEGVTPDLLYGLDANHNGVLEQGEGGGEVGAEDSMERGWASYLTLHSVEANVQPDGSPKIDVNQSDLQQLYDQLEPVVGEQWANYIVAYRQYGPQKSASGSQQGGSSGGTGGASGATSGTSSRSTSSGSSGLTLGASTGGSSGASAMAGGASGQGGAGGQAGAGGQSGTQQGKVKLTTVLDLIGSQVQIPAQSGGQSTTGQAVPLECPFPNDPSAMSSYLPKMMECLTVNTEKTIPGRLNINQAPRVLLQGIPGMDEDILDQIISARKSNPAEADESRRYETWILQEGIVTLDQMKKMIPFITGGGSVYRVQSVGYFEEGGIHTRLEVILNATTKPASVVFWRDISHLGRGFPLETLGIGPPGE